MKRQDDVFGSEHAGVGSIGDMRGRFRYHLQSGVQGWSFAAEGEGFEPPVPFGTLVFKTSAFNHSATPPK